MEVGTSMIDEEERHWFSFKLVDSHQTSLGEQVETSVLYSGTREQMCDYLRKVIKDFEEEEPA